MGSRNIIVVHFSMSLSIHTGIWAFSREMWAKLSILQPPPHYLRNDLWTDVPKVEMPPFYASLDTDAELTNDHIVHAPWGDVTFWSAPTEVDVTNLFFVKEAHFPDLTALIVPVIDFSGLCGNNPYGITWRSLADQKEDLAGRIIHPNHHFSGRQIPLFLSIMRCPNSTLAPEELIGKYDYDFLHILEFDDHFLQNILNIACR